MEMAPGDDRRELKVARNQFVSVAAIPRLLGILERIGISEYQAFGGFKYMNGQQCKESVSGLMMR